MRFFIRGGRLLAALAIGLAVVVGSASPAAAHTVSGIGATNWKTTIRSVQPAVAGLRVRVVELGNRLEVSNTGPEVTVLGYGGEPYLRVGPAGVWTNLNSQATYLNKTRQGSTPLPPDLPTDPAAPPRWQQVSSGHLVRWHDHRIHWMGTAPPPQVRKAPNQSHLQSVWEVDLRQGATPVKVTGELRWLPGPSPWPWLGAALVVAVGCGLLGRLRQWGPALAIAVGGLILVDVAHSVGIAGAAVGGLGAQAGRFVAGSYYSFIGWILGVIAIRLLLRRSVDGLYAAVFTAASAFLFSGLLDLTTLHRSEAPFVWGTGWDRVTVTIALGGGLGVALGAVWALRRAHPSDALDPDPSSSPSPLDSDSVGSSVSPIRGPRGVVES
jgi:hypothetical protein